MTCKTCVNSRHIYDYQMGHGSPAVPCPDCRQQENKKYWAHLMGGLGPSGIETDALGNIVGPTDKEIGRTE